MQCCSRRSVAAAGVCKCSAHGRRDALHGHIRGDDGAAACGQHIVAPQKCTAAGVGADELRKVPIPDWNSEITSELEGIPIFRKRHGSEGSEGRFFLQSIPRAIPVFHSDPISFFFRQTGSSLPPDFCHAFLPDSTSDCYMLPRLESRNSRSCLTTC